MPAFRLTVPLLAALTLAAPAGWAQTPTETSPAEDAMLLAFKHKPGAAQKFRGYVKMDAAMSPEGGETRGLSAIPLASRSQFAYMEKVTGAKDDGASITMTMDSLTTTMEVLTSKTVVKLAGGKVTASANGKALTGAAANQASTQIKQLAKPAVIRRASSGATTAVSSGQTLFGALLGSSSFTVVEFSDKPVKVGETWETVQKIRPSLAGAGFVIPEIEFKYTHTLRAIETKNGKKSALIDSTGLGETPNALGGAGLAQSISGATRFDIDRGAVMSSQFNIVLSLQIPLPAGAAAPPGGPTGLRMDGNLDLNLTEAALPVKAPAKKRRR